MRGGPLCVGGACGRPTGPQICKRKLTGFISCLESCHLWCRRILALQGMCNGTARTSDSYISLALREAR